MAKQRIKLTGIVDECSAKAGGHKVVLKQVKLKKDDQFKLTELVIPKAKDRARASVTIEVDDEKLPGMSEQ